MIGKVVLGAAQSPQSCSSVAIETSDRVGISSGDQISAVRIFGDAVQVKPIPRIVFGAGPYGPAVDRHVAEREMIACSPLEQQRVGYNIDLLEDAVPNVAICPAKRSQISRNGEVGRDEGRVVFGQSEFVIVTVCCIPSDSVCQSVRTIQLGATSASNKHKAAHCRSRESHHFVVPMTVAEEIIVSNPVGEVVVPFEALHAKIADCATLLLIPDEFASVVYDHCLIPADVFPSRRHEDVAFRLTL